MFGYPAGIRRAAYTTNTIESLDMTPRKVSEDRSRFPNDEAVFKLLYSALRDISEEVDDADQELGRRDEPVRDPLRRSSADGRPRPKLTYTHRLELPLLGVSSQFVASLSVQLAWRRASARAVSGPLK